MGAIKVRTKLFAKDLKKGVSTSFITEVNKGTSINKVTKKVIKESK